MFHPQQTSDRSFGSFSLGSGTKPRSTYACDLRSLDETSIQNAALLRPENVRLSDLTCRQGLDFGPPELVGDYSESSKDQKRRKRMAMVRWEPSGTGKLFQTDMNRLIRNCTARVPILTVRRWAPTTDPDRNETIWFSGSICQDCPTGRRGGGSRGQRAPSRGNARTSARPRKERLPAGTLVQEVRRSFTLPENRSRRDRGAGSTKGAGTAHPKPTEAAPPRSNWALRGGRSTGSD